VFQVPSWALFDQAGFRDCVRSAIPNSQADIVRRKDCGSKGTTSNRHHPIPAGRLRQRAGIETGVGYPCPSPSV
jgi:hypothetical protein